MEGIVPLIIIGIVLNMIIKAVRARTQKPPQRRPAPPPNLGQEVERPLEDRPRADLGQDVDRPLADRPRPQVPHTPIQPQNAPRVTDVRPVSEKRDPTKGVSLEGTSMEGTSLESQSLRETDTVTEVRSPITAGKMVSSTPVAEWFRGDGMVRGIVMSEVLNPPVSRRR